MPSSDSSLRDTITESIRNYLDVIDARNGATLYDLAKALDQLVITYHSTPDVSPDSVEASAAPKTEERPIIDAVSAAFPDLGFYALVDPDGGPEQGMGMALAPGDLAEIAVDLLEVLWLFENAGHNDAVWEFRFGYQYHWGKHLHELRPYLHCLAAW